METIPSEATEAEKQSAFEDTFTRSNNCSVSPFRSRGCHVKGARICRRRGGEEDGTVKVLSAGL